MARGKAASTPATQTAPTPTEAPVAEQPAQPGLKIVRDPRAIPVETVYFSSPLVFPPEAPIHPPAFWGRDLCVRRAANRPGQKAHPFTSECVYDSIAQEVIITFPRGRQLRIRTWQYLELMPEKADEPSDDAVPE